MAFVICEPCVDVKDTACVEVCPVDCIYEFEGENMLYIHPVECIDCAACEPECPVEAIFPLENVPSQWQSFIEVNREIFDRRSTDEAVSAGGPADATGDGPDETAAVADAAPPSAEARAMVAVSALSRERVALILEAVEDGVLDPEVALIQLTGLQSQAAPAPAAEPEAAALSAPAAVEEPADQGDRLDDAYADEVKRRAKVVPAEYRRGQSSTVEEEPAAEASDVPSAEPPSEPAPASDADEAVAPAAAAEEVPAESEATEEPAPEPEPVPEVPPDRPDGVVTGFLAFALRVTQPVLGALPARRKFLLEGYAGPEVFSSAFATWSNVALSLIVYAVIAGLLAMTDLRERWHVSYITNLYLLLGLVYGFVESLVRTWSSFASSHVPVHRQYRASLYGWLLGWLVWPIIDAAVRPASTKRTAEIRPPEKAIPGGAIHAVDEMEKRRRYGMAHTVRETPRGYEVAVELARVTPPAARAAHPELPAELPHYELDVRTEGSRMYVYATLADESFAEVLGRATAFPGSFLAEFALPGIGSQFHQEYDAVARVVRIQVARAGSERLYGDLGDAA